MKVVVDTNVLITFFWKNSFTKRFLQSSKFELISPKYALEEIAKYKRDIMQKTRSREKEFTDTLKELKETVNFISRKQYSPQLKEAEKISPDKADADFLALCLKEKTFLWSNDSLLKTQGKVNVLNTEEMVDLVFD
jgi:predicted nucleic acid-binding protein